MADANNLIRRLQNELDEENRKEEAKRANEAILAAAKMKEKEKQEEARRILFAQAIEKQAIIEIRNRLRINDFTCYGDKKRISFTLCEKFKYLDTRDQKPTDYFFDLYFDSDIPRPISLGKIKEERSLKHGKGVFHSLRDAKENVKVDFSLETKRLFHVIQDHLSHQGIQCSLKVAARVPTNGHLSPARFMVFDAPATITGEWISELEKEFTKRIEVTPCLYVWCDFD